MRASAFRRKVLSLLSETKSDITKLRTAIVDWRFDVILYYPFTLLLEESRGRNIAISNAYINRFWRAAGVLEDYRRLGSYALDYLIEILREHNLEYHEFSRTMPYKYMGKHMPRKKISRRTIIMSREVAELVLSVLAERVRNYVTYDQEV